MFRIYRLWRGDWGNVGVYDDYFHALRVYLMLKRSAEEKKWSRTYALKIKQKTLHQFESGYFGTYPVFVLKEK